MQPSQKCADLAKEFEGLVLEAYRDPVGIWTVGWGHTRGVYEGVRITISVAEDFLRQDLMEAGAIVRHVVKVPLNQNQFDALTDFVFNVGPGVSGKKQGFVYLKTGKPSTMLRKLNAGDYAGCAQQFKYWVYAGGVKMRGLERRRKREQELFNTPS